MVPYDKQMKSGWVSIITTSIFSLIRSLFERYKKGIAMVWNCSVILLGFVLFDTCFSRVINRGKALLFCYYCEEHYYGKCGEGNNMKISNCLGIDKSCFYKSYYDPFNNGHGGRYKYERGCTPCDTEECLANTTQFTVGLKENLGTMKICAGAKCNINRMNVFQVDEPIGVKPL
ncbi:uncharacterized protein LOC123680288 [Harmonia axyridis]|uniref:uncharacterized protein LOC123680288 n=1 Tax=Harmonia axyridis TaxID=115357 RepID=UPI001E275FEF|nr:uncharacterized protein LOC123680288 [Harmonia axyridis]